MSQEQQAGDYDSGTQGTGGAEVLQAGSASGGGLSKVTFLVIGAVALLLVGAVSAAALLLSRGPQPQDVLPESTLAVAVVDMDPSLGQKVNFVRLMNSLPQDATAVTIDPDDPIGSLIEDPEAKEFWGKIKPWIGSKVALALTPGEDAELSFLLAVQVADETAARKWLDSELPSVSSTAGELFGLDITGDEDLFYTIKDGYALISASSWVVDQVDKGGATLANNPEFAADRGQLGDQLIWGWFDATRTMPIVQKAAKDEVLGDSSTAGVASSAARTVAMSSAVAVARNASSLWALYQGSPGDGDVKCAATCTQEEILRASFAEFGIEPDGGAESYSISGTGDFTVGRFVYKPDAASSAACVDIFYTNMYFDTQEVDCVSGAPLPADSDLGSVSGSIDSFAEDFIDTYFNFSGRYMFGISAQPNDIQLTLATEDAKIAEWGEVLTLTGASDVAENVPEGTVAAFGSGGISLGTRLLGELEGFTGLADSPDSNGDESFADRAGGVLSTPVSVYVVPLGSSPGPGIAPESAIVVRVPSDAGERTIGLISELSPGTETVRVENGGSTWLAIAEGPNPLTTAKLQEIVESASSDSRLAAAAPAGGLVALADLSELARVGFIEEDDLGGASIVSSSVESGEGPGDSTIIVKLTIGDQ